MIKVVLSSLIAMFLAGCGEDITTVNLNNLSDKNIKQLKDNGYKLKTNLYVLSQDDYASLKRFDEASDIVKKYLVDINQADMSIDPSLFGREFAGAYRYLQVEKENYIQQVVRQQELELAILDSTRSVMLQSKQKMEPIVSEYAQVLDPLKEKGDKLKHDIESKDAILESINDDAYELMTKYAKINNIDVYIDNKSTRLLAQGGFHDGACKNKQYTEPGYVFHAVDIDIENFNCYYLRVPESIRALLDGDKARSFLEHKVKDFTKIQYELYGSSKVDERFTEHVPLTITHNSIVNKYNKELKRIEKKYGFTRPDAEFEMERANKELGEIDREAKRLKDIISYSVKEGFKTTEKTGIAKAYRDINDIFTKKHESILQAKFSNSASYQSIGFQIDNKIIPENSILFFERVIYSDKTSLRRDAWVVSKQQLKQINGDLSRTSPKMTLKGSEASSSIIRPFVDSLSK